MGKMLGRLVGLCVAMILTLAPAGAATVKRYEAVANGQTFHGSLVLTGDAQAYRGASARIVDDYGIRLSINTEQPQLGQYLHMLHFRPFDTSIIMSARLIDQINRDDDIFLMFGVRRVAAGYSFDDYMHLTLSGVDWDEGSSLTAAYRLANARTSAAPAVVGLPASFFLLLVGLGSMVIVLRPRRAVAVQRPRRRVIRAA